MIHPGILTSGGGDVVITTSILPAFSEVKMDVKPKLKLLSIRITVVFFFMRIAGEYRIFSLLDSIFPFPLLVELAITTTSSP